MAAMIDAAPPHLTTGKIWPKSPPKTLREVQAAGGAYPQVRGECGGPAALGWEEHLY